MSLHNEFKNDINILIRVTQALHKSSNLQEIYKVALDSVTELDNVDTAMIYLVDEGKREAVLEAHKNLPEDYLRKAARIPYLKGVTWKAISSGKILTIEDVEDAGKDLGHHGALGIPIFVEEKIIGLIWFISYKVHKFDEAEINILSTLGDQVAIAIAKAKILEEMKERQEELCTSEERYRAFVELTYDLIAETGIDGQFLYVNPKHKDVLGYETNELLGIKFFENIHPDDRTEVVAAFESAIRTVSPGRAVFRFRHKNGSWRWLESTGKPFRTASGQIIGVIASRDITERKRAEELIKESLREKEVLLKEIHHRVKNNLQVISSLINLQSQYIKGKKAVEMFNETQNRIRSMALIHEQLYQSRNVAMIGFKEYAQNLLNNLLDSYEIDSDAIELSINIEDLSMTIDNAIPCGLIINELVSNSLKYAFPRGRKGKILIGLHSEEVNGGPISSRISSEARLRHRPSSGEAGDEASAETLERSRFTLIVSDNGVGFPKDLDFRNTESLGLQLVVGLAEQIRGSIELNRRGGTSFKIKFEEL